MLCSSWPLSDPRHPDHPKNCRDSCCVQQPKPESDEEGEEALKKLRKQAKRLRKLSPQASAAPQPPAMGATEQILTLRFPETRGFAANDRVVKAFKRLDKFEVACQGDDHGDPELRKSNSEALHYSRAAAVMVGQERNLETQYEKMGEVRRRPSQHRPRRRPPRR